MVCPRCHAENREGRRFCGECGLSFASTCPSCGFLNEGGEKFCGGCGRALTATARPVEPRFGSPQTYTPKHLAEKILTSKTALEGERKQVTVLFADLKGSMELLADRDPEEARKILDPILERMMEAVHRYEGTVNQVMGDGIMALFGAPLAHEDHAVRACYAALRMQESVKKYAEEVRRSHTAVIKIRVGLNSGEVVVRAIGSDLHMDYTAVGQTTHLAARMEQLAEPGTTVLTPATRALAEDFVQMKSLGPMRVKGLSDAVEVYELVGANAARSRFQAHAARGLTKFVGRTNEMAQLAEALDLARGGRGQVVGVVGEPGVGKSRLFWEFAHSHRTDGSLVIEAASVSYGKAMTYLPVSELLRSYFQIEPRDDTRKIREKVTGKLLSLDRALEAALPALLALLDVPVGDESWTGLDPPQRRQRTLDAVKGLLLRESHVQPLVVIFEDLHWIDGETQAVLEGLVESLPTARVLLLANYRPEYQHAWGSKTYYRQIRIDALSSAGAEELLEALLGRDSALDRLKQLLIDRTDGNPFFLEESARALVETKFLAGERGAYCLAKKPSGLDPVLKIPASTHALLAARVDRLSPEHKRLLQAASVIGTDVPFILIQAIADESESDLGRGLATLQAAEFLYETRLFPEVEYTFKHALTHEVAYGSLPQERRRALHVRIVDAMETLYADRPAEQVERLAYHTQRGEVWDKALTYLRQAGEKSMARSAHREAAGYFEQALGALQYVPETRATREQAIDLRLDLRNALQPSGDWGRMLACLREAESLATVLNDHRRLGQVAVLLSSQFYTRGAHNEAVASAQRALALATASGDVGLHSLANRYLGNAYEFQGDYRRARDCFRQTVASLEGDLLYERFGQATVLAVHCRAWLAVCHAELGTFTEGSARGDEGLRIAEAVAHPSSVMVASWGIGLLSLRQGDLPNALSWLERSMGLCQDAGLPVFFPRVATALGAAYALAGRVADAIPLLTQAMEQTILTERTGLQALCSLPLGEAQVLAGRLEEANALAEQALAFTRTHQQCGDQAYALRLLGEIAARREPPEVGSAEDYYRQALALAEPRGMRPLVAHCHLGLGKLYRRTGKREQAQEHLTTATTMYREMEMAYWLERAEAEMGKLA